MCKSVPVHKKESKNSIKNYRPISLLPIFGKIYEKIIYNNMYKFFESNNLLSSFQSGFRAGDSCVCQLLSITHEIYSAFDCNPPLEVRGIFLDILKAFDRVWHGGLLFKLSELGISGPLLILIQNFLQNRKQRAVLNGVSSSWCNITAGVPQGSILGPLFFLVYINDLPDNLLSIVKIFADNTSIFSIISSIYDSFDSLQHALSSVEKWVSISMENVRY